MRAIDCARQVGYVGVPDPVFPAPGMKKSINLIAAATLLISAHAAQAQQADASNVTIYPNGSRPAIKGAAENFTGSARIAPLKPDAPPSRLTAGQVTFEPGARSAWHTHPLGQMLVVTSGTGWTQEWGGKKRELHPGDVVWCPPGVKHWHGATSTTGMTHIAVQEVLDGKNVEWMEKVSDEQYEK